MNYNDEESFTESQKIFLILVIITLISFENVTFLILKKDSL